MNIAPLDDFRKIAGVKYLRHEYFRFRRYSFDHLPELGEVYSAQFREGQLRRLDKRAQGLGQGPEEIVPVSGNDDLGPHTGQKRFVVSFVPVGEDKQDVGARCCTGTFTGICQQAVASDRDEEAEVFIHKVVASLFWRPGIRWQSPGGEAGGSHML